MKLTIDFKNLTFEDGMKHLDTMNGQSFHRENFAIIDSKYAVAESDGSIYQIIESNDVQELERTATMGLLIFESSDSDKFFNYAEDGSVSDDDLDRIQELFNENNN